MARFVSNTDSHGSEAPRAARGEGHMQYRSALVALFMFIIPLATPAFADVIYNNLTPNNQMAVATRPIVPGPFEIEAADDFVLSAPSRIDSASFVGVIVPGPSGQVASVVDLKVEIYRVFPVDSNTTRDLRVLTRMNSPSDVAFDSRDAVGDLTFSSRVISPSFTALNSVKPGGINDAPIQTTGGNGPLINVQEVQFDVTFTKPFDLPADHYFFVPQVGLNNDAQFFWLSASRNPISGPGTTPFAPDLQTWTRDQFLDPDWSRVGTDIVGGGTPPTFNAAFALNGTVPEPSTLLLIGSGMVGFLTRFARRKRATKFQ